MNIQEHCNECNKLMGKDYREVHAWLDEFFMTKGPFHRKIRHHIEGIEEVRKIWGDDAAKAAELHIKSDMFGLPVPHQTDYIGGDGSWPVGDNWNNSNSQQILL